MAVREELVSSAITFLQDPSVAASTLESRIAFLQSKNLTQEEVDAAIARAGGDSSIPSQTNYASQQQMVRPSQPFYGGYSQGAWQQPPPDVPRRDWRDWFIMATVMGGVGYGLYFAAKRYVVPLIAPPTAPQIEQDKAEIDASFEKAFALLDQLAIDTEALKASEAARTDRLDGAITEVESVISELKSGNKRREEESRRISDEVRSLKDLIPKAMEGQKENTDNRLQELNTELKSLKKLMGQRLNPAPGPSPGNLYGRVNGTSANVSSANTAVQTGNAPAPESSTPKAATVSSPSTETATSMQGRSSPFPPTGSRSAIPAWQMAAANKNASANASASSSPALDTSSTQENDASA